jgi:hypothetical protein
MTGVPSKTWSSPIAGTGDQDHPAAEGTMVFVLSAVVPWAFRNAKAFQGVDQKAGKARCSLAIALGPSFLSHLKHGQGKQSGTGTKGVGTFIIATWRVQFSWIHGY